MEMEHTRTAGEQGRVKVYRLNTDGGWDDLGTGVLVCRLPPRGAPGITLEVVSKSNGGGGGGGAKGPAPHPSGERLVFRHEVEARGKYSRENPTIITWAVGAGVVDTDVALSFAKEESCEKVWSRIVAARKALLAEGGGSVTSGAASPVSSSSESSSASPSPAKAQEKSDDGMATASFSSSSLLDGKLSSPPPRDPSPALRAKKEDALLAGIDADDMEDMLTVHGQVRSPFPSPVRVARLSYSALRPAH